MANRFLQLLLILILVPLLLQLLGLTASVSAAAAAASSSVPSSATSANGGNATGAKPYWHRPGCYLVGHTRTISIPGCVKFNLSTNACRGFCMSFSIPAAEDIGPTLDQLDGTLEPANKQQHEPNVDRQLLTRLLDNSNSNSDDNKQQESRFMDMMIRRESAPGDLPEQQHDNKELDKLNTFLHLSGQTKSPLAGTVGDTSDKRDVISVGQCCNMMETEDVTVNLRCGFNETRRLVFKSAKTCECFFCKHV